MSARRHPSGQGGATVGVALPRWSRFATSLIGVTLCACGASPTGPGPASQITVIPTQATLVSLDETLQLSAVARDAAGREIPGQVFKWSSSNPAAVSVSASGLVTALMPGTAVVGAALGGVAGGAEITVAQAPARLVFVTRPPDTFVDAPIPGVVGVGAVDANANPVRSFSGPVTLKIGANPGGGSLLGTAVPWWDQGMAGWTDLVIDRAAHGYTLIASFPGVVDAISEPFDVVAFTRVTVGKDGHSCALTASGAAYCWGRNSNGQLGTGDTWERGTAVAVIGGHRFQELIAGGESTCGLASGGAAYCWGADYFGQLGDGPPIAPRSAPTAVTGGLTFTSVSTGYGHVCGLTAAGTFCWGSDRYGILGTGTDATETCAGWPCSTVPVRAGSAPNFAELTAGNVYTCGLTDAGAAYCWGHNGSGELGDGTTIDRAAATPVSGHLVFRQLSAGVGHTCGILHDGAAYCWGYNGWGQLGDGTQTNRSEPVPVVTQLRFAAISAGFNRTCAFTSTGQAYCWGFRGHGQPSISTPDPVAGGLSFLQVCAGGHHDDACGVTTTGAVYCWSTSPPAVIRGKP
jgi:alpha-tubulin suppressor-like RCC1 family protein